MKNSQDLQNFILTDTLTQTTTHKHPVTILSNWRLFSFAISQKNWKIDENWLRYAVYSLTDVIYIIPLDSSLSNCIIKGTMHEQEHKESSTFLR